VDVFKTFTALGPVCSSAWVNSGEHLFCFHGGAGPQGDESSTKLASHSRLCWGGLLPPFGSLALSSAHGKVEQSCIKSVEWLITSWSSWLEKPVVLKEFSGQIRTYKPSCFRAGWRRGQSPLVD